LNTVESCSLILKFKVKTTQKWIPYMFIEWRLSYGIQMFQDRRLIQPNIWLLKADKICTKSWEISKNSGNSNFRKFLLHIWKLKKKISQKIRVWKNSKQNDTKKIKGQETKKIEIRNEMKQNETIWNETKWKK
jgi:hypothetical protein